MMARAKSVSKAISKNTKAKFRKKTQNAVLGRAKRPRYTENHSKIVANTVVAAGGRTPAWQTLPYQILLQVFQFAAYPLLDELWNRTAGAQWLLRTSTTCRAFLEPALSALYHAPPILHMHQFQSFSQLIQSSKPHMVEYASKVHQLDFEINYSQFSKISSKLAQLLPYLPALRGLGTYFAKDHPRFGRLAVMHTTPRSSYNHHTEWLDSLKVVRITRLTWHNLDNPRPNGPAFERIALREGLIRPELRMIEQLEITAFYDFRGNGPALADALQKLPALRRLTFTRSTFNGEDQLGGDDEVLCQLPQYLTHLAFIDCNRLGSVRLQTALRLSGRKLKCLTMRHNKDANLQFLTRLAETCPELEYIDYDLSLYPVVRVSAGDTEEPKFKELMGPEDVPSWPSTLQRIDMNQLRKWEGKAAENFFRSLLDSAEFLPDLRRISITASVGSGWRERAALRERLIVPLQRAFLRVSPDPDPSLSTLRAANKNSSASAGPAPHIVHTRSGRVSQRTGRSGSKAASDDDDDVPILQLIEQSQTVPKRRQLPARSARSQKIDAPVTGHLGADETQDPRIQGMCDVVYIRVDNLRPAGDQMHEEDFLDSERSGDEAWDPRRGDIGEDD